MIPFYEQQPAKMRIFCYNDLSSPLHLHTAVELVYVKEGILHLLTDEQDTALLAGSLTIIFPNTIHGYYTAPDNLSNSLLICCEADLLPEFSNLLFQSVPSNPILPPDELHPDVLFSLKRMEEDFRTPSYIGIPNPDIPKAFLQLIFGYIFPKIAPEPIQAGEEPDLLKRLLAHITLHFQEPLSLDLLANVLGTSKFRISRIFSQKLHIRFNEYVNRIRLDYAAKLIQTTDHTMVYICMEAGFENQQTFNRIFKRYYQMTPKEYRRK